MKSICAWLVIVLLGTVFQPINAAAITNIMKDKAESTGSQVHTEVPSTIYLLDWKENKIHTSKGVFVTDGIQVVNKSGIEKDHMAKANPPPVVELVLQDGMVKELIILKNK